MPLPAMHPRPGNLREVAEEIDRATGLRVEILGGALVMSPPRRGKHAGSLRRLRQQLAASMPDGPAAYEVTSIAMPDDSDDYCTPDLVILPDTWDTADDWLADPLDVELAVEVISKSERAAQINGKNGWYAAAAYALSSSSTTGSRPATADELPTDAGPRRSPSITSLTWTGRSTWRPRPPALIPSRVIRMNRVSRIP
ncbi:Uma2 family endonuclease [Nocardia sp. NPDC058705]|uniref:Uma2 family endonuclease n=1 Tax=Nocardia sp. NPDC058705 TaxID=3346609 RepID=UPI0036901C34